MKKIFFFAALLAATMVNAQVYDLSTIEIADADITVTNGTKALNEEKGYFEVKNTAGETVEMTIAQLPNMSFTYKNSAEKKAFVVKPLNYIQFDGNQRDLTISGLTVGQTIKLSVASKGSTGASFADSDKGTAFTGCIAVDPTQAGIATPLEAKGTEGDATELVLQAIAETVTIRETAGGYLLTKIDLGEVSGVENIASEEAKAKKVMIDGQIYIIKNGVKYNVLGAAVK